MKTLIASILLALTSGPWVQEIEPNDTTPQQLIGFSEARVQGALASDTDVDRYYAWLGFPFPWLTEWLGPVTITGTGRLEMTITQTNLGNQREVIGHGVGYGRLTLWIIFIHNPWKIPTIEIEVRGKAQRYEITAPK